MFLLLAVVVFLILSFKDPYGKSSLIGNFDPFPDSLHYVVPARNFALGGGFNFSRESGEIKIGVPPVYSWSLIPTYLLNSDARSFYFTNLALGIISIILLYKISWQLTKSVWATGLLLFLYVTSFVIYWQPSLAMAENVLLPVVFAALWLMLQPLTNRNIVLSTILAVACYGSKYVAFPVTGALILLTLWRIWQKNSKIGFFKKTFLVSVVGFLTLSVMSGSRLIFYLNQFWQASTTSSSVAQRETSWLSLSYLNESFPQYFAALLGLPIYNLWHTKAILPLGLAAMVLCWCIYAVFKVPKQRDLALLILLLVAGQLAFLSTISMIEGRYAFTFIPAIFTGTAAMSGWLLEVCKKKLDGQKMILGQILLASAVACLSLFLNFKDLKTQLLVNFKGGETPWWQVGIMAGDQFMTQEGISEKDRVIIISSLSPFVWDFYRQSNYLVMPLYSNQSMVGEKIWGTDFVPKNLLNFYQEQLKNGRKIYLSTVGFSNSDWQVLDQYEKVGFHLQLLQEDCLASCKIYRVELSQ